MAGKTVEQLQHMKQSGEKIAMLTAYDYPTAQFVAEAGVDMILVGDSLGMVVLGFKTTRDVTMEIMLTHVAAARRGAPDTHLIADMPYRSFDTPVNAARNAQRFAEIGADAVKIEGCVIDEVRAIRDTGIEVMGHVGVLPQTTDSKLKGRDANEAQRIFDDALALKEAGCYSIVLENLTVSLARKITETLSIPTIGIGAGPQTDGQVLVIHDVLGMFENFLPPFAKRFAELAPAARAGCAAYVADVRANRFPDAAHSRE